MGDNIHLGDRDGVRTPMQWSPDRNGGFSRADPAALVLPPIMDPLYGYQAVNVEAQARDPHSLLQLDAPHAGGAQPPAARSAAARMRFLYPQQPQGARLSARATTDETILCVVQRVAHARRRSSSTCREFAGRVPVELLGGSAFPPIGQLTYLLTLPPYGFYWFMLQRRTRAAAVAHAGARADAGLRHARAAQHARRRAEPAAAAQSSSAKCCRPISRKRRWFAAKDAEARQRAASRYRAAAGRRARRRAGRDRGRPTATAPALRAAARRLPGRTSRLPAAAAARACARAARAARRLLTDAFALPRVYRAACSPRLRDSATRRHVR